MGADGGTRTALRVLRPRAGFYNGKPDPHHKRGYALISPTGNVVGGPYTTTGWANEGRRLFYPEATIELVEVTHAG